MMAWGESGREDRAGFPGGRGPGWRLGQSSWPGDLAGIKRWGLVLAGGALVIAGLRRLGVPGALGALAVGGWISQQRERRAVVARPRRRRVRRIEVAPAARAEAAVAPPPPPLLPPVPPIDRVREASEESFPASDAPAWSRPMPNPALSCVEEASEESFPASDAPAWIPITSLGPPRHRPRRPK